MAEQLEWVEIGQRVRDARLAARLSQDDLGRAVDLDRTMVAKIEAGTRRIDAVELARLGSALSLPLSHFLRRQPTVVSRRVGILEDEETDAGREAYLLEAALLRWLEDVQQLRDLGLLVPNRLLAFQGEVESETAARAAAGWLREELSLGSEPIPTLMVVCERAGMFVCVEDLSGDGASVVDGDVAVAVVSKRGDPGRRRATAAHELGHLVLGDEYSSDIGVHASREDREAVVDAFAAEFLLPAEVIAAKSETFTRDTLVALAATFRTSWSLAVRQAVRGGALDRAEMRRWISATPTRAELMEASGWAPQPDLEPIRVPPSYAHAVIEARKRRAISTARAVELMRGQIEEADLPALAEGDGEP